MFIRKNYLPVLFAFAGFGLFSCMDALIKLASRENIPVFQTLFFLNATAFGNYLTYLSMTGWHKVKTDNYKFHLARGIVNFCVAISIIYSFIVLDLGYVYSVIFLAPILTTLMTRFLLGEKVGKPEWTGMMIGFGGIIIAMRPWQSGFGYINLLPLVGAFFITIGNFLLKAIGKNETPLSIAFYSSAFLTVVMGLFSLSDFRSFSWTFLSYMFAAGCFMTFAVYFVSYALKETDYSTVGMIHYSQFLWGILFSAIFFGQNPSPNFIAGAALICLGGLIGKGYRIFRIKWL